MPRSIVCIPEKFGGAPHIEGTDRTIAEVQTFWDQPGVHADQLRQRFPELSEAEIGAAVAWVEPKDPTYLFVAEGLGPSPQRFTICGDTGDWAVLIENLDADGVVRSSQDYWETTLDDALRYFERDDLKNLTWTDARSGVSVDLASLMIDAT